MSTLGEQIRELRIAHNISMLELAKAANCCAATVKRVEAGEYCSKDLAIKAAVNQMVAERQTNRVVSKRLVIVGSCRRASCGINLVASPEDIRWGFMWIAAGIAQNVRLRRAWGMWKRLKIF